MDRSSDSRERCRILLVQVAKERLSDERTAAALQSWDEGMLGLHDVLIENVRQAGWLASCPLKQPLSHGLVAVMPLRCCRILLLE